MLSNPYQRIEGGGRFLVSVLLSEKNAIGFRQFCAENDIEYQYIQHGVYVRFRCAMTEDELVATREFHSHYLRSI